MEAKTTYGSVSPPWWSEVWIVARGPSVRRFDYQRLVGKQVIGVNTFVLGLDRAAAICSIDPRWIASHRVLLSKYEGEKYLALPVRSHPDCAGIPGATYLEQCHERGLSDFARAVCTGGNSGYAALNVAVFKRAKDIHLVGFDMDPKDGEKYLQWAPLFRSMRPQLDRLGIQVTNHNRNSFIDAFPTQI